MAKIKVNGPDADPLFKYLTEGALGLLGTTSIKWNFTKFLCDRDGHVVKRIATTTAPKDMRDDIKSILE